MRKRQPQPPPLRVNDLRTLFRKYPTASIIGTLVLISVTMLVSDVRQSRRSSLGELSDTLVAESHAGDTGPVSAAVPATGEKSGSQPDPRSSRLVPAEPGEIRIADWNIRWFPSGSPEPQDPEVEATTMREAAKIIRRLEPNILCAEEIRSKEVAEQFADHIRLPDFRLAVCSAFTNYDGTAGLQQTAVFSTYPVIKSRWDRWHTVGFVDPPRGYSFALLDAPGGPVGVFAIHLKSNYISQDAENPEKTAYLNRLKRQFATKQVLQIAEDWKKSGFVPKNTRFIVAGDFNTAETWRWEGETTLSDFRKAGWHSCYEGLPRKRCYTLDADPVYGYDAVAFDYIFTQGFSSRRATQIRPVSGRISDHAIVVQLLR